MVYVFWQKFFNVEHLVPLFYEVYFILILMSTGFAFCLKPKFIVLDTDDWHHLFVEQLLPVIAHFHTKLLLRHGAHLYIRNARTSSCFVQTWCFLCRIINKFRNKIWTCHNLWSTSFNSLKPGYNKLSNSTKKIESSHNTRANMTLEGTQYPQ